MQFRQITANKYIGEAGYTLQKSRDGRFSICKDRKVTKWGQGFQTVRSAEIFLDRHNYIHATTDVLPISPDDIEFLISAYGLDSDDNSDGTFYSDVFRLTVPDDFNESGELTIEFKDEDGSDIRETYNNLDDLLLKLDELHEDDIFASVIYRGIEFRPILAARNNRSSRDITKNLVRVKSSNVWAYGVEIKDSNAKVGDVYVQFKGKNGGPGDIYKVYDVPISLWRRWIGAPSKGHFYNKYLRNSFLYSKLTGDRRGKLKNAVN